MAFTQTLTAAQTSRSWRRLVEETLGVAGPVTLTKADLKAATDAVQLFLWTNRTALNTAIPLPARTDLTTEQKMALLAVVAIANLEG
jgi:hypothetical protein